MDDLQRRNDSDSFVQPSKIRHVEPLKAAKSTPEPEDELEAISMVEDDGGGKPKTIRALGVKSLRHDEQWQRTPNATGKGAIHVKTFHCKVTDDGLSFMDQQINEWLDAHPEYEVKIVETSVGTFSGKTQEPHVICQVWV